MNAPPVTAKKAALASSGVAEIARLHGENLTAADFSGGRKPQ